MSYFDLDPRASADMLEQARKSPTQIPTASLFEGAGAATGKGLLQGVVAQPALLLADAATPALRPAATLIDGIFGGTTANDWLTKEQGKTLSAVKDLMPDENTGLVGNLGYGMATMLPQAVAGTVLGGPAGGAATVGGLQGYASKRVAESKGVDALTATGQGAIEGAAAAIGVLLPASIGAKLLPSIGVGMAGNVGVGMASRGGVGALLEARGYSEMAKQYRAFDGEAIAIDAVLGGAFGVVGAKLAPKVDMPPSAVDAALATRAKQHIDIDAAPGAPVDPAARAAHAKAIEKAIDDLANDRPVDVSQTGVADVEFIPMRAEMQAAVRAAVEESAPLGRALDAVDELRAKAKEMGLDAPDEPILAGRKLEAEPVAAIARSERIRAEAEATRKGLDDDRAFLEELMARPADEKLSQANNTSPMLADAQGAVRARPATDIERQAVTYLQGKFGAVDGLSLKNAETLPKENARALMAASEVAKLVFGKTVVLVEQPGQRLFNGLMSTKYPDMIFVDAAADKAPMAIVGHELLHALRNDRPDLYAGILKDMREIMTGKDGYAEVINGKREARGLPKLDDNIITEEMIADVAGGSFTDPKFWGALKAQDKNRFERFATAVRDFLLDTLIKVDGLVNAGLIKRFGIEDLVSDLTKAREVLAKAFSDYSKGEVETVKSDVESHPSISRAVEQVLEAEPDFRAPMSELYPTSAARELERADNSIQKAAGDAKGVEAAVACFLRG